MVLDLPFTHFPRVGEPGPAAPNRRAATTKARYVVSFVRIWITITDPERTSH
jgi:hypothetical protein